MCSSRSSKGCHRRAGPWSAAASQPVRWRSVSFARGVGFIWYRATPCVSTSSIVIPAGLGPKFMTNFSRERDIDRRRVLIARARHRGSVPPDLQRALRRAIVCDQLRWYESEVDKLDARGDTLKIQLTTGAVLEAQSVLLATGFASHRPGGSLVDRLVASASLPCARCGYPIVDVALRWHPRVHVSGPLLADLEMGPVSRNIAGARRAGDRLVEFVRSNRPHHAEPTSNEHG